MPQVATPRIELVAWTQFAAPPDVDWQTDAEGGEALAEFAGRACYQAWDRSNPKTATNAGYLDHVLQVGHVAVLEHSSATFYLTGISASAGHELVRHRHFSFSQLSARQDATAAQVVEPPEIAADPRLHARFAAATEAAAAAYAELLELLQVELVGPPSALRRKLARQAARSLLPAAVETRLVMTGNFRSWRHFIGMRAAEHADPELRALAVGCLRRLQQLAPNAFADFGISALADGTEVASSPLVFEA